MKTKIAILFFLFLAGISNVFPQSYSRDVIYLKNGSIIKGTIIEQVPGKTYKIQTSDNNIFTYTVDEVEKITSEPSSNPAPQPSSSTPTPAPPVKKTSTFGSNGVSGIVRAGPLGLRSFTAAAIGGYSFEGLFFLGLGVSVDAYKNIGQVNQSYPIKGMDVLLPVFLDIRMFSGQRRFAFMWLIEMGYAPLLTNATHYRSQNEDDQTYNQTTKGGTYYNTGVGLRAYASNKIAVLLEFGLKIQNYTVDEHENYYMTMYDNVSQTYTNTYVPHVNVSPKTTVTPYINFGLKF